MTRAIQIKQKQLLAPPSEIVEVTPEIAREWLRTNEHNRDVKQRKVADYTDLMEQQRWQDRAHEGPARRQRNRGSLAHGSPRAQPSESAKFGTQRERSRNGWELSNDKSRTISRRVIVGDDGLRADAASGSRGLWS